MVENVETPLVSIIVPTFNSAKTLEATLKSISCQTYPNIETIVVDNHSTDDTREIARRHGAKVYLKGPERAAQDNHGVKKAHGKYVFITGGDMIIDKDYVMQAVKKCEEEGYDAIYASVLTKGESFWQRVKGLERKTYVGDNFIESARFFRREVFLNLGGYDESLVLNADDYDMQHRLDLARYKTARITAVEWHTDEPTSLKQLALKSYYYAEFASRYMKKYPSHATKQLFPVRLAFIRHINILFCDPLYFIGFIIFKIVQYSAGLCGFIAGWASKEQINYKMHQRIYGGGRG
jgi:glycosyltransferase involved in cell wall biosynthesis